MRIATSIMLLLLLSFSSFAQKSRDTIKVYFDIAVPTLDDAARGKLDAYAYHGNLPVNKKYGIIGYADYLGVDDKNQILSERRAENVKQYLQGLGVHPDSIQIVMGKGTVKRDAINGGDGYKEDRRVDIIIGGIKVFAQKPKPVIVQKAVVVKTVDTPKAVIETPQIKAIDITKVKKNETLVLENIYFVPGSHMIRTESIPQLMELVRLLDNNPKLKISIEGHICCHPYDINDGYDYDSKDNHLSRNRAKYIYDYLIDYGIAARRLDYKGFAFTKPLVMPEKTEEDKDKNRRVEIRILDK